MVCGWPRKSCVWCIANCVSRTLVAPGLIRVGTDIFWYLTKPNFYFVTYQVSLTKGNACQVG